MTNLAALAGERHIPQAWLQSYGFTEHPGGILIKHFDSDGSRARSSLRKNVSTSHPTWWPPEERHLAFVPFGADRVTKARERGDRTLRIAEGETDPATMWANGLNCIGLPGATQSGRLREADIAGFNVLHIHHDGDAAGDNFVRDVAKRARDLGFAGDISEVRFAPHKDVSDLFCSIVNEIGSFDAARERFAAAYAERAAAGASVAAIEPALTFPPADPISIAAKSRTREARDAASFVHVGDLLDESDFEAPALVEGMLRCGATALVASKPKVGKTSWLLNLGLCVARGTPFLGQQTMQGPVLYVALEGNRNEWRAVLKAMGVTKDDPLFIYIGQAPQDAMRWLRENAESYKPVLIIVDTLQRLTRMKDLNDYAAVTNASEAIVEIAQTFNATLVLAHHAKKKSDGDDGDGVLGSTALVGFVDTLVTLRKSGDGRRTMRITLQRYGEDFEETVLALDVKTKLLTASGSRVDSDRAECEARILNVYETTAAWLERDKLLEDVEARKQTKNAALLNLIEDGRLLRIGVGRKGDPFLYAPRGTRLPTLAIDDDRISGSQVPTLYAEPERRDRKPLSREALCAPRVLSTGEGSGTPKAMKPGTAKGANSGTPGTTNLSPLFAEETPDEMVFD